MSNVKKTKHRLVEKSSGRKIVSPWLWKMTDKFNPPTVTIEMKRAGVDVLEHSDYGYPIMFETTEQIVEEIYLAMHALALKQHHDNKNETTRLGTRKAAKQRS